MLFVTEPDDRSGTGGLRAQKKQAARTAILEAALDLFSDRGFDDTTVPDIAARAGVSPATVARYFPSKESMLFGESNLRLPELRRAIIERPSEEKPFHAVVHALYQQPWTADDPHERLLRSRLAILRSPVLRGQASRLLVGWRSAISDALETRGVTAAEAGVVAVVITALLDDASDRWALGGGAQDLVGLIAESIAAFDRSFGHTP